MTSDVLVQKEQQLWLVSGSGMAADPGPDFVLTTDDLRHVILDTQSRRRSNILIPVTLAGQTIKSREEVVMERVMESCAFKSVLSGVVGSALGAALGLFSASVGPDATMTAPEKQTVKQVFLDMKGKSLSYAKNFGVLGFMFAGIECIIESVSFTSNTVCLTESAYDLRTAPGKVRLEERDTSRRSDRRADWIAGRSERRTFRSSGVCGIFICNRVLYVPMTIKWSARVFIS